MTIGPDAIVARFIRSRLSAPLIRNDLRGEIVEEIVLAALEPDWQACGSDWGAADLVHAASGMKMQVKQSAAKQTWTSPNSGASPARFSIAHKAGRWDQGSTWVAEVSRNADLFVFAWHPVLDERCDHRDPCQWQFLVVPESMLPAQKSIGLKILMRLAVLVGFDGLANAVAAALDNLAMSRG